MATLNIPQEGRVVEDPHEIFDRFAAYVKRLAPPGVTVEV